MVDGKSEATIVRCLLQGNKVARSTSLEHTGDCKYNVIQHFFLHSSWTSMEDNEGEFRNFKLPVKIIGHRKTTVTTIT